MSPMSKTLLKIILAIQVIYIVVAAVPVFQQVYQSMAFVPVPSLMPALPSPTVSPAAPEQAALTVTATVVAPAPTATALEPTLVPELSPTPALTGRPIHSSGAIENGTHTYILSAMYRSVEYLYQVQDGTPIYIQNFAHAYAACSWMSVAGQVLDANGEALTDLVVSVNGTLNGSSVELLGLTGLAQEYGPGGYEIQLSSLPTASTGQLTIQIFDLDGNALTELVPFDTSAGCSENVVLINFAP